MSPAIGFIGLGKLGLPCALAVESKGYPVYGYDISETVVSNIENKILPYREVGAQDLLDKSEIKMTDMAGVVRNTDIIFVPIQTPHDPMYEGVTRIPDSRVDFNYDWLKSGIQDLSKEIEKQGQDKVVIIISTVLPGTIEREIKPLLNDHVKLCYNPFFIAMGTTLHDFLNPEFVLFGVDDEEAARTAENFYRTLHDRPFYKTTIKSAELIKVAYNTFIGMKISFANTMMEICHKIGADVDAVSDAMSMATDRLISGKYLRGGMGDGGGCHPRDNIAMSWLAGELDLSYDFFDSLMKCREDQTEWLAQLIVDSRLEHELDHIIILGKAFKEETNLTVGSPATLLKNLLDERELPCRMYDPHVQSLEEVESDFPSGFPPAVYFVATKHDCFQDFDFPEGSVVLDPWRFMPDVYGSTVIRIGQNK